EKSIPLAQLFEPIRADLERVDLEFGRHVQSQVDLIPKIGQYIQTSGGKRVRPAVLLMASRLSGYHGDRAILYAAVVEFIHTETLVHDVIIRRKTAYLFGGCAQIGGMLGKVSSEREEALREYGFNLGIAFQLVDDLLDFTGDTEAVGKPIGSDLREGKVTLPLIHLLRQSSDGDGSRIVRDAIASHTVTPEQWAALLRSLKEHASIDYAYRRALEYAERAKKPLYAFPPSSERDALLALPDYVLSRDR